MKEKKTQSIPKQLFVLAFVLIVLVAGSYAWLTLTIDKTNTNVLRAGTLSLVLDDTTSGCEQKVYLQVEMRLIVM